MPTDSSSFSNRALQDRGKRGVLHECHIGPKTHRTKLGSKIATTTHKECVNETGFLYEQALCLDVEESARMCLSRAQLPPFQQKNHSATLSSFTKDKRGGWLDGLVQHLSRALMDPNKRIT